MNLRIFLAILSLGVTALVGASPAQAQATRTWVSGVGDDVNPCSRTAPCKTFAGAISKTAAGGEINCLDPGGFGTVTVTKSITIDCTGTMGSGLAAGATGVIVNGANIIVTLRGLSLNGGTPSPTPGINGVRYLQGARLTIEDCVIFNFLSGSPNGFGVLVNNTTGSTQLVIRNTVIRNNGAAASGGGIGIVPTGTGAVRAVLENVMLSGNFRGLDVSAAGSSGAVQVLVNRSTIALNNGGVNAAGGSVILEIRDSALANNTGTAIAGSGASTTVAVANSTIISNGTGISAAGGAAVLSFGDNLLNLNVSNGAFTGPAAKS